MIQSGQPDPRTRRCFALLGIVVALALPGAAAAQPREPLDLIPGEALLCWQAYPPDGPTSQPGQPSVMRTLIELGLTAAAEPLDRGTQLNVRIAEMLSTAVRYPYALALLDASARPIESNPSGRRLDKLSLILVVQSGTETEPFLRIIQKAVNEQTSGGQATLNDRTAERWTFQELRDARVPEWAAVAWGRIEGYFILTLGPDVWPAVAATAVGRCAAVAAEPWYAEARAKRRPHTLVEVFAATGPMVARLDPLVEGRASAFLQAWNSGGLERGHWALGLKGRALFCEAHLRRAGETITRVYADPDERDPRLLATIPDGTRYAIYRYSAEKLLTRLCGGLAATQRPDFRAALEQRWSRLQEEFGFDAQRDLLAHLGERIITHNDPPHPLNIPIAMTTLIEIRDEPATVRRTLDALCAGWQATLDRLAEERAAQEAADAGSGAGSPAVPHTRPAADDRRAARRVARYKAGARLQRDDDGVWYIRFATGGPAWLGLAGPAWTVTDRFIVASWSPAALREYLEKVGDAVGKRPAP
ncbi:MAG: hypothetical protein AB1716_15210 [Planctomycetota bacterium]